MPSGRAPDRGAGARGAAGGRPPAPGVRPDTVYVERTRKGRRGKTVTLVINLPGTEVDLHALLKELKATCGAGGTLKDGVLEVQGDHRDRVLGVLTEKGIRAKPRGG